MEFSAEEEESRSATVFLLRYEKNFLIRQGHIWDIEALENRRDCVG